MRDYLRVLVLGTAISCSPSGEIVEERCPEVGFIESAHRIEEEEVKIAFIDLSVSCRYQTASLRVDVDLYLEGEAASGLPVAYSYVVGIVRGENEIVIANVFESVLETSPEIERLSHWIPIEPQIAVDQYRILIGFKSLMEEALSQKETF